ncbi:hypothetical protein L596_007448 [Steinernema carpocapsae]|uniref:Uncharacterized protein n=1 Tax=Steinernema carpocapsae TaxID=34508 RepID=A0A4U5P9Q4_STECR|nr:hypothetical protein L596_007448 [Steinernema carpocapsae]
MAQPPVALLPHTFYVHNSNVPTVCAHCSKLLTGLIKQGLKCRYCKVNVHKHCSSYVAQSCRIEKNAIVPRYSTAPSLDHPMAEKVEGWMVYFLLGDPSKRHKQYWVLDYGAINMFDTCYDVSNPHNSTKRLYLSEIVSIALYEKSAINKNFPPHFFEIRTLSNVTYCVGENPDSMASRDLISSKGPEKLFFRALSRVLLGGPRVSPILTPHHRAQESEELIYDAPVAPNSEVYLRYDMPQSKFLGSGLFGLVYRALDKCTRSPVVIKIIPKERFSDDCIQNFRFEVERARKVSHPLIARIDQIFEVPSRFFLISKVMSGNMNDMILSYKRLNDRVTRFLVVQILCALRYLHCKGFVHSNLKPENVLIADDRPISFPQIQVADFGFARFLQDQRCVESVVGREAYLAPEVLQRSGFDHTSDLYSVGVIIYVALTGKVPSMVVDRTESETISISSAARDIIKRLLENKIEDRMADADECLEHAWFNNVEMYLDLRNLEMKSGLEERFLTTTRDDARFEPQLRKLNISDSYI